MLLYTGSLRETCSGNEDNCEIPNYGKDHNVADAAAWGEDPATATTNTVAAAAAKTAGGVPHPFTLSNGINAKSDSGIPYEEINPKFHLSDVEDDSFAPGEKQGFGW
jgi:hypothetical protein